MNVVDDVAMDNSHIGVGVDAYDDGTGSEWIARSQVVNGAEGVGCSAPSERGER